MFFLDELLARSLINFGRAQEMGGFRQVRFWEVKESEDVNGVARL